VLLVQEHSPQPSQQEMNSRLQPTARQLPSPKSNLYKAPVFIICFYCCDRKAWAECAQSFTLWQQATIEITCHDHSILLVRATYMWCCSLCTFCSWWTAQCQPRGCNNIPSFFSMNRTNRTYFYEGVTWHNLHILVTVPFCCNWKARVACDQSFTLWQQPTIEITRHNHFVIACPHHIYMVLLFAHIPFVVNCAFSTTPT